MIPNHTLHHHAAGMSAVTLSPDGDRLISGGKSAVNYLSMQPFIAAQAKMSTLLSGTQCRVRRCRSSPVHFMVPLERSSGFPTSLVCHQVLPLAVLMVASTYINGRVICTYNTTIDTPTKTTHWLQLFSVSLSILRTRAGARWSSDGHQVRYKFWQAC